jgi:hypothetical protein
MTIGGLKKTSSPLALVAAAGFLMGGMALTPASAADLGGDCCADLEERVAELEATTARKGNRKVSLTISGHVARDFGWYEDENGNSEIYSTGHGPSGTRLQFAGSAALTSSWTAGYTIRFRMSADRNSTVLGAAGANAGPGDTAVTIDRNFVYLKNDRLGTFVVGQAAAPTGGIAGISLGGHGVTGDSGGDDWNASGINGFNLEQDGAHQAIAWISPTFVGFTFAVAWSDLNDAAVGSEGVDAWDMALRYAQEFGPIRIAAGIGLTTVDHDTNNAGTNVDGGDVEGSVALMHTPTGLNVSFAAGTEYDGGLSSAPADTFDQQFWYVTGGINRDFTGYGNTSIFGEFGRYDYDNAALADDTVDMWGLGVVQHFDKAATELYLAYRHWDQDGVGTDGEVDQVMAGMRIKF